MKKTQKQKKIGRWKKCTQVEGMAIKSASAPGIFSVRLWEPPRKLTKTVAAGSATGDGKKTSQVRSEDYLRRMFLVKQ